MATPPSAHKFTALCNDTCLLKPQSLDWPLLGLRYLEHGLQQNIGTGFEIFGGGVLGRVVAQAIVTWCEDHGCGTHPGQHLCIVARPDGSVLTE